MRQSQVLAVMQLRLEQPEILVHLTDEEVWELVEQYNAAPETQGGFYEWFTAQMKAKEEATAATTKPAKAAKPSTSTSKSKKGTK